MVQQAQIPMPPLDFNVRFHLYSEGGCIPRELIPTTTLLRLLPGVLHLRMCQLQSSCSWPINLLVAVRDIPELVGQIGQEVVGG